LGDRAQAPSGAGYALQNRLAMARSLPEIYRTLPVERLAGFFQAMRAQFSALAAGTESRVAMLTPGPLNETYFEHAYLARYLGFLLTEGA
uniref:circularly permuted type 2 ATP-grasp protein n=1 Tax=Klebsiella michiganensis TaxID=1134687 RepID=UPI0013D2EF03